MDATERNRQFQRTWYRTLSSEIQQLDPKLSDKSQIHNNIETMKKKLSDVQTIYGYVDRTNEALLDADVLASASRITAETAKTLELDSSSIFKPSEFVDSLKRFMDIEHEKAKALNRQSTNTASYTEPFMSGLANLGALSSGWFGYPATTDFLVGPMSTEYVKRKARVVKERVAAAPMTKVSDIGMDNVKTSANMMTKLIQDIYAQLKECDATEESPVGLFEFALNPTSFSQSVENLFYISFLVYDGRVGINFDDDGVPVIYMMALPSDPQEAHQETVRRKKLPTNQMIFDIDMETWRGLIELLEIKNPTINTRAPVQSAGPGNGTWFSG